MEKKYYIIGQAINLESKEHSKGLAFLTLSPGRDEPKYVLGDRKIAVMGEVKDGNLVRKSNVSSKYKIMEVSAFQFEFYKERYNYLSEGEKI